ncbi:MAG: hypothetical protein JHC33_12175 [Ignisphaera sp.]|nr:hypothetical protein [Ignisphaera sp.]
MRYTKNNRVYSLYDVQKLYPEISISDGCNLSHLGYETLVETVPPSQVGSMAVEDGVINNELQWKLVLIPIVVPDQISPRQARLALLQDNLLDKVNSMLSNDKAMQIWWEYSLDIQRNHEHIIAMATPLGLTESQLDDLFILGGSL